MHCTIDSEELRSLIETGQKALKGNSNDTEHDALYEIVMVLEVLEAKSKKASRPDAESP